MGPIPSRPCRREPKLQDVATWDDVRRVAASFPETAERSTRDGIPQWRVRDKLFVWERPLRRADIDGVGYDAPKGPILGVPVSDVGGKEALLAVLPDVCFTSPHFDGYPSVLVRLVHSTL